MGVIDEIRSNKGRSSLYIRQDFPTGQSRIPTLWTSSYFGETVGGTTLEIVKQYVANQRHV